MKNISFRDDVLPLKNVLYRLALRITLNREEAEDIVQDTLIKIWNNRERWSEIESMEAYGLTICRNLAIDRNKRASNSNETLDETDIMPPASEPTPYEKMLQKDRFELVKKLIDTLPEKQRSCMQLRDFEGKSYKDISHILEISEEQVKISIFRARQAIKQKYDQLENYGL